MKTILSLAWLLLLLPCALGAQTQIFTLAYWDLRGPVKSVVEKRASFHTSRGKAVPDRPELTKRFTFDRNGNTLTSVTYLSGKVMAEETFRYDRNGRRISGEERWESRSGAKTRIEYTWDAAGRLTAEKSTVAGKPDETVVRSYTYDSDGRVSGITIEKKPGSLTTTFEVDRDSAGNVRVRETSATNGEPWMVSEKVYGTDGGLRRSTLVFQDDGAESSRHVQEFDSTGRASSGYSITFDYGRVDYRHTVKLDAAGNWIERRTDAVRTVDGREVVEPYDVIYRQITYYKGK